MRRVCPKWAILLILVLSAPAIGMDIWPEITGEAVYGTGADTINVNMPFTIEIHFSNTQYGRSTWSTPFELTGTGNVTTLASWEVVESNLFSSLCWMGDSVVYSCDGDLSIPDLYCCVCPISGEFPSDGADHIAFTFHLEIAGDLSTSGTFCIDSAACVNPMYNWMFEIPHPDFGGPYCWPVQYREFSYGCGDANGDGMVNLLDVTFIINWLYKSGPAPYAGIETTDVNYDCTVNILDVSYLISYLYRDGPAPNCAPDWPCPQGR